MKWLKNLLTHPLKDMLPGKLRVWHLLLVVVIAVAIFKWRFPGGRPFDNELPAPSPIANIDDPENVLATLTADFDSSAQPMESAVVLHLARACDAVYADGETSVPRLFFDLKFDRVVPIGFGSDFVTVGIKDDIAVVVFRGTDEIKDWYTNLSVRWEPVTHGRLHSGFWSAYQSLRKEIIKEIDSPDLKHLWVCGHSLGGAMALCCAYDLTNSTELPLSGVVTFGQPKLADNALARQINADLAGKYLAVVADEDPVADTVPLCHFCGDAIWFDGDRVRYSSGRVEAMQSSPPVYGDGPGDDADEPFFQDVMTEDELRRKQERVIEQENPPPRNPNEPPVYTSSLPFFRDHNMSNYIGKLRQYFAVDGER